MSTEDLEKQVKELTEKLQTTERTLADTQLRLREQNALTDYLNERAKHYLDTLASIEEALKRFK